MAAQRLVMLAILDGWGIAPPSESNAVYLARTPNMDSWQSHYPYTTLVAHNGMVGLPEGQMGNSEVGHLNIGAGRIVYQDYTRINLAIKEGSFQTNPVLTSLLHKVKDAGTTLHLCGLLSDGGVHSHLDHLFALLAMAASHNISVKVHCFMDGRDTPPSSGLGYMQKLVAELDKTGGAVATVSGRYWAMDRDTRWDRIHKAWLAMIEGQGNEATAPLAAVENGYTRGETDEFISPTVLVDEQGHPVGTIQDGDAVLFFNFRADRVRELCHAFSDTDFSGFPVLNRPQLLELATMTRYEADFSFPVLFPPLKLTHILGEEVSRNGLRQLRIAETEKYAHVTYFFNGGREEPFAGEDRILIESPRDVATYDEKPAMSAVEVTDALLEALNKKQEAGSPYALVVLNFANGDMVGHTGKLDAAIKACETVDSCLGRIAEYLQNNNGILLVTADHGNAEIMKNPDTGEPFTAHTLSPVPLILVDRQRQQCDLQQGGALQDIAPTLLELLGVSQPDDMSGTSLLQCNL
jgi:2,3-bisphosphoglycerate-independent phosphoglycerate mutase